VEPALGEDIWQNELVAYELAREAPVDPYADRLNISRPEEVPYQYDDWVKLQYSKAATNAQAALKNEQIGTITNQLLQSWQGLGENVGIGSAGTPQAEMGGRLLPVVANDFARKLVENGITDISQAKFAPGSQAAWTAEGKGNVSLIATPDGRLIPVWGSSSDASAIRSVAIGLALTFTGAGAAIGSAVTSGLGVSVSAATNALIGNTIVNTVMNGGDVGAAVKSSLASYAGAEVGNFVGEAAKTVFDNAAGLKLVTDVATNATKAVLLGGDVESAIVGTLASGAVDLAIGQIPDFKNLPSAVQSTIRQSISSALQGKDVDVGGMLASAAKEGLLSYGLSQIPDFSKADQRTQSFVTTMLRTAIDGGDLSQSAVNWAVGQAQQELQKVLKAGPALDELKKAGIITEASYYSLDDRQKELVDRLAQQKDPKAAAAKYINEQTTTPEEIRQFYKQLTGKDATAADADLLATFTGMDEATARVGLDNQIRANTAADELRLTELQKVLRNPEATDEDLLNVMNEYNITPSFIQKVTSKSYDNLVYNMRGVSTGEAEAFAEKANLDRPLTPDEIATMRSGSRAQAETFAQRLSDIEAVTFRGDVFADQGAAELAAKQAGYNNYTYDGKTYLVNDSNIAASFDGGLLKETMRLITGALKAEGLTWEQAPPEKLQQLVKSAHALYGNDVLALKGASIQDFINGNTGTLDDIKTAYNNSSQGDGFRVEIRGVGYTSDTPDANTMALPYLPPGVRLATSAEAFESNGAAPIILSNGSFAWVTSQALPSSLGVDDSNIQILSPEDPSSAAPQQYLSYVSKLDPNKSIVSASVINGAKAVVDTINKYGGGNAAALTEFVSVVAQGGGELVKLANDLAWASGIVQRDNVVSRTADWLSKYGASIQSATTKQQEDNIVNAVQSANGVIEKSKAFFRAAKDNPLGALTMVGKEAVQEVPMLIASGGVGRIVSGIAGKAIGFWAATGTDSVLNAGESFSANFGETYDNIKRAGGSDEYAKSQAYKSGAQAAVVGFGSNLIADSALVKAFMGEATKITAGTFTKLAGKQYVTEWGEEFLQNASVQYNSFGQVDWNQAQTAGAIGGAIGMGVASGIMSASAINYNMQVAVDSIGRPVTLQQFIDGSVQVQPGSFNAQAPIFDIKGVTVSLDNFNKVTTVALEQSDFSFDAYATNLKSLSDQGVPAGSVSDASLEVISATPEQARTIIKNYVDLGLTANTPTTTGGPTAGTTPPAVTPPAVTPPAVTPPTAAPPAPTPAPLAPTPAPLAPTPAPPAPTPAPPVPTPAPPAPTPAPPAPTPAPLAPTPAPLAPTPAPPAPTPAPPVPTPAPPVPTPAPPAPTPAPPAATPAPPAPTPAPPAPTPAPPAPTPAPPAPTPASPATTDVNASLESRLSQAIQDARTAGLQGDAALQTAINSVSSELGTTKEALLGQIGKTEEQLRTDFSTQLGAVTAEIGNVETRLQDAIAAAEARGLTRDQAIQSALDTVATDLGTTKSDLLTQIGTTESTLRGEIEASQAALGQQITSTEQRLNEAIAAAESRGLTRDQAIQAGLDQVATDLGTTKSDILSQLGSTASDLRAEIEASQTALGQQITTGLEGLGTALSDAETRINTKAAEYEAQGLSRDQALSRAIGDVATQLGTTAQNLQGQITEAKTQLSGQITSGQTALQKQIDEASTLLGKPAQAVTQADLDYVNSVIRGDVTTTPDLTYDVNRDGKIDQSDYDFLNRATTGSGEPPEFAPGSRWAPTGLFGDIADLKTDLTGQFQQMEQKRLADAAKAKAEQEAKQRRQTGLEMLKPAAGPAKTETETKLSPLQTSGQSKYLGPLAAFFSQVEKGDFTPTTQQQTTMAPQQQTQPDRYAYGQEPSIDDLLDPYGENKPQEQQSPFGFKAGGLATPMFAAGGGTRYGQYAKGGLNVVHHSGKARIDFRRGAAVTGPGDGQSDDIPAMLADGEFVFPADVVAALGNGSTKAGSDKLYDMMHSIRAHARSSGPKDLPPPAKSPLEYLKKTSKQKSARG
jgi:hypothetical protein